MHHNGQNGMEKWKNKLNCNWWYDVGLLMAGIALNHWDGNSQALYKRIIALKWLLGVMKSACIAIEDSPGKDATWKQKAWMEQQAD